MAVSIETILAAVPAAVVVNLAVDVALKPRMEARKERILIAHRDRQRLLDRLGKIGMAAARLSHDRLPSGISHDVRQALRAEDQRAVATLEEQTRELVDDLDRAAGTYIWRIKDIVIGYATLVRGWSLSERTAAEKGQLIVELTIPVVGFLGGSPWRPGRQAKYLREACALIEKHTGNNLYVLRRAARPTATEAAPRPRVPADTP